jgi:hypothetical protein
MSANPSEHDSAETPERGFIEQAQGGETNAIKIKKEIVRVTKREKPGGLTIEASDENDIREKYPARLHGSAPERGDKDAQ